MVTEYNLVELQYFYIEKFHSARIGSYAAIGIQIVTLENTDLSLQNVITPVFHNDSWYAVKRLFEVNEIDQLEFKALFNNINAL